jgi:hypothetical protein
MINRDKSYEENISADENKHYSMFVDKLISGEEFEPKHKLLLEADDIYNIVFLSILYVVDKKRKSELEKEERERARKIYFGHKTIVKQHGLEISFCYCDICNGNNALEEFESGWLKRSYIKSIIKRVSDLFGTLDFEHRKTLVFALGINLIMDLKIDEAETFDDTLNEIWMI